MGEAKNFKVCMRTSQVLQHLLIHQANVILHYFA